jgi:hypothetical protein
MADEPVFGSGKVAAVIEFLAGIFYRVKNALGGKK